VVGKKKIGCCKGFGGEREILLVLNIAPYRKMEIWWLWCGKIGGKPQKGKRFFKSPFGFFLNPRGPPLVEMAQNFFGWFFWKLLEREGL